MCVTIFPKDFHHFNNHEALLSLTSKPLDFKQPPPPHHHHQHHHYLRIAKDDIENF